MKPCPDLTELVGAESLPDDHPLREHLRTCGRCRAALRAYGAFQGEEPEGDVSDAEAARAERKLAEFIDTELLPSEPETAAAPQRDRRETTAPRGWLAMAAVLVVAVGLALVGPRLTGSGLDTGDELRGDVTPTPGGASAVTVTAIAPGEVRINWAPVDGARDYEIILWTAALEEYARLAPTVETEQLLVWDVDAEPGPVFCSVVSRQGGREFARSELVSLPSP